MPGLAAAGSYRAVLRLPFALRAFVPALGGRLAYGLLPLATLFTVQQTTGSYARAGLALAAFGLASITLPLKSRLTDTHGQRRVLPWLALACAGFLALAAVSSRPVPFVALAGLAAPPLGPAMRSTWRSLTEGTELKQRAYALDAVAEETLYLTGPLLAGLGLALAPARWTLLATAALLLLGTLGMVAAAPVPAAPVPAAPVPAAPVPAAPVPAAPVPAAPVPAAPVPAAPVPAAPVPAASVPVFARLFTVGPLRSPGLLRVLAVLLLVGAAISAAYTGMAAEAQARGRPGAAGLLEAAVAVGSILGGLLWSRRHHTRPRSHHFAGLLALLAAGLLAASVAPSLVTLGVVMAVGGSAVAPLYVVAYLAADELSPPGYATEAGTWINVAANAGSAVGAAGAGVLADRVGPVPAFSAAGVVLGVTAVIAVARQRGGSRGEVRRGNE